MVPARVVVPAILPPVKDVNRTENNSTLRRSNKTDLDRAARAAVASDR